MSVQTNGGFPIARCQDCQGRFTEDPQSHPEITTQDHPGAPGAPGHERIDAWGTVICRVRALGGTGAVVWKGKTRVFNLLKDPSSQPMPYFLVELVGCWFLR